MVILMTQTMCLQLPRESNSAITSDYYGVSSDSIEGIPPNAGSISQRIRKGEVVIIHVDGPRMHWQLEVVDSQK